MSIGKILRTGDLALPPEIQRAIGVEPGDLVDLHLTDHGTVEIRRLSPLRLADALERYRIHQPIDDGADRDDWQDTAVRDILGHGGA